MTQTICLLHGANSGARELAPLAEPLQLHASVITPDLLGHGGRSLNENGTIQETAEDVIRQLDAQGVQQCFLFGYSFGGCLALYLARHFPHCFVGVATLAAKVVYDRVSVTHLNHLLEVSRLSRPGNPRGDALAALHAPQDWKMVAKNNQDMFTRLGREPPLDERDLREISLPALILSGDRDQLVPVQETMALGHLLPNAEVKLMRGQSHPLSVVPLPPVAQTLLDWMSSVEGKKPEESRRNRIARPIKLPRRRFVARTPLPIQGPRKFRA